MKISRIVFLILLTAVLFIPIASIAETKEASFVDDVEFVRLDDGALGVTFKVKSVLGERLTKTLDSGLPVKFTYNIRLVRLDKNFWEGDAVKHHFIRVLEKDNLKNKYIVSSDDKKRDFSSLQGALDHMNRVADFRIVGFSMMQPEGKYQLEIQVKFEEFRLPFLLHRFLPFVSMWDVQTPWRVVPVPTELHR